MTRGRPDRRASTAPFRVEKGPGIFPPFAGYTLGRGPGFEGPGLASRLEARADIVAIPPERPTIAVAIPCFNEAGAIEAVVDEWRLALPEAEIVVFDNNSSDGTGAIARRLGLRVVEVPEQGKGFAVRAIFEDLADRDAVILVDGDGTYPADAAPGLLEPVLAGRADMTVGNRRPVAEVGAMSPIRGLGNVLIGLAFFVLIGPGTRDLLSGYRVFGRRFREVVRPRSTGFEIEAELVGQAVARGLRVVEIDVPYRPRIAGTASKLRAFRDGRRILEVILRQSLRFRPWRPLFALAVAVALIGLAIGSWPVVLVAATLLVVGIAPAAWFASRS
jgi:glycosyltransferase involved in cell wall biosynthesis